MDDMYRALDVESKDGDHDEDEDTTLKEVIDNSCRRIDLGAAVLPRPIRDDPMYPITLRTEFNAVVVEHHLKWTPLCHEQPGPFPDESPSDRLGRYDFHHADQVVDWAMDHDMKVKGHVLCWHVTTPKFLKDLTAPELRKQLRRHIWTVMGHYRGRIHVWDVVNEALAPDGSLADNLFLKILGPSYIEECFQWAHEADPEATLLYNDNKVEGTGTRKSDGFYELLADLKAKNVPVHGCGIQAHFNAAGVGRSRVPTPRRVKEQIARLGKLGLTVNISEMDVRVTKLPPDVRQVAHYQIYHDILAAALTEPAFDGLWLWGFTDKHTWVTHFYHDDEPLIFDEEYQRKGAYHAVHKALSTLTVGGTVGGGVLLDADTDDEGRPWGYEWMQPEPEETDEDGGGGDARPDWEVPDEEPEHELT